MKNPFPANPQAESFCLASVFYDNAALSNIAILRPEDFSLPSNREIFAAMLELRAGNIGIDRVSVANALNAKGRLEACGGVSKLVGLDENMPRITDIPHYARLVKDCAILTKAALLSHQISQKALDTGGTPSEAVAGLESALASISQDMAYEDTAISVGAIIQQIGIQELLQPAGEAGGIQTGFYDLDDRICGLQRQNLIVIGARPSVGKTALACNIAINVARRKVPVAIFSMEMSKRNLVERLICSISKTNLMKLRSGIMTPEDRNTLRRAAVEVQGLPIHIDDSSSLTHQQISSRVDRLRRKHNVQLVFLDYLQQMGFETRKGTRDRNDNERLTEIAEALKATSKRQDVAMVALSQLSRAPEMRGKDHRPMLSDLRASGGIEQAADLVLFLFREFLYNTEKEHLKKEADIIIGKARNGPTGSVKVQWEPAYATFENR